MYTYLSTSYLSFSVCISIYLSINLRFIFLLRALILQCYVIYLRKPGLVNIYKYFFNLYILYEWNTMCASKKVWISCLGHYLHYLSSHTQPADPNPFLGTHGMYVYMCQFCILYLVLEWVPKRGGRRTHCILSLYIYASPFDIFLSNFLYIYT